MTIKLYGERNTGTQFLRDVMLRSGAGPLWPGTLGELGETHRLDAADRPDLPPGDRLLLREALADDLLAGAFDRTLGWKHGAPDLDRLQLAAAGTVFVVAVKNPYAWVVSMYRRPHHNLLSGNLGSIEAFLASPWACCGRDNLRRHVASIVDLWTLKYQSWIRLSAVFPTAFIRYEDVLRDPQAALQPLGALCGLRPGHEWRLPATVANHDRTLADYRAFYAREGWRDALSDASLDLVNARLDHALARQMGYATISR